MKLQAFILLTLLLAVSAGRRRYRGRMTMPPPEGGCAMVQPFDQDFVYTYKYIAYTEHRDFATASGNDVRITCTATITVPRRCSGKLRVSDCQLDEGRMASDGAIAYSPLPSSAEFAREMEVGEMAFHFNGGQITRIFVDKQERTNVTNFKRGILSSLQAYNPELPRGFEVGDLFEVPEISVYGQGIVRHRVVEKIGSLPSVVEVIRDTAKIELPWERRQWNFIRMRNNNPNPLLSAFQNYITLTNEERWAKSRQICRYEMKRGRLVDVARCEERFPLNPIKPEIALRIFETNPIETVIRQEITLKATRRMTQADRSQWDVSRFDEESIMFEEEWEETNTAYTSGFDAGAAFIKLIREPVNDKSPAIISKLSRWLAISSQAEIELVWSKCESQCSEQEKADGRILWVELLNSCISNDFCQIPYCPTENATTCQRAMENFVSVNYDKSPEIRDACLSSLEYIRSPSVQIIKTTLTMCRVEETTSPACVRTLGVLVRNFYETCGSDCENKKPIADAKDFLVRQLKKNCQTRNDELEEVMMASIESIGRLGVIGRYAEDTVFKCATNPNAPARVVIRALVAYDNMTTETLSATTLNQLVEMFLSKSTAIETRITCFHFLMKKNLPVHILEKILTAVMDETEHPLLIEHCRDDIRTQLLLRGTAFCQIHPEVAQNCVRIILRNRWDIGISRENLMARPVERKYSMMREIFIPYFEVTTNCTIKVTSVFEKENSIFPIMARLVVFATVEGRNVSVFEAAMDIAGMKPVLDRIFGHNQFYAELFGRLLSLPTQQLHGYSKQYPAMNALAEEGKFDYIRNIFNIRSPINLQILGYPISLDSLMGWDMIRRLSVGNFMEILEGLEKGFEHKAFVARQPFLMQHATPTCIGAPITSTIEMSYILKNTMSLRANLRKMLFALNEKAVANVAPELFLTGSIRRSILEKFTESSGTELRIKAGHESAVECSMESQPNGWSLTCTPKQGKSRLFHLSAKRSLTGAAMLEPTASVCQSFSVRSMCTITMCKQPAAETGFAYEIDFNNHFDTEFTTVVEFQAKPKEAAGELVKEWKFECSAERRSNPSTKKILMSTVIAFAPERKELGCQVECEWFRWRGAANLMFPMHGSNRGLFASVNSSGLENLEFKYFNVFQVIPETDKSYSVEGQSRWMVGEETRGYGVRGVMLERPEGRNVTRKAELKIFAINNPQEHKLSFEMLLKKVPNAFENMQGYEVWSSLMGPWLPWHKKYETVMVTYDNGIQYDKVMRLSGHWENAERNPLFFIHRIKGSLKQLESEAFDAQVYCVSNYLHWQFVAACDAKGDCTQRGKLNLPEQAIPYSEVVTQENPFTYDVQTYRRPMASFIEYNFTTANMKETDRHHDIALGWRLWSRMYREYYFEKAAVKYVNHRECRYCHTLEIRHPKLWMRSVSRSDGIRRIYHEEKWLRMHYSLLNYVNVRPYISYYLINNLKNGWLELGWRAKSQRKENLETSATMEFAFLRNTANCSLDLEENFNEIKTKCIFDAELIPLKAEMGLHFNALDRNPHEIAVFCDAKYAGVGCNVSGLFKLSRSNDFTCSWNASYGSYPAFEYDDELELSFKDVHSRYNILGAYRTTYKPVGIKKVYRYLGTSERLQGGKRDLEIKAMCPSETEKICGKLVINKNGEMVEFERYAYGNNYDRAVIRYENGKYILETEMASELFWGVKRVALSLELNENAYGVGMESKIFNASCRYADETGFELKSIFKTSWLEHELVAVADSASARYKWVWDRFGFEGARTESNMTLNYVILDLGKPMDAGIVFGSGPRSIRAEFRIPDFDFTFDRSVDRNKTPMRFKYFCDARVVPYKVTINNLRFPFLKRELEVKNTKLGLGYRDSEFYEMFIRDILITFSPKCEGITPVTITGNCAISYDKILLKVSSSDRSFVADVDITPATPKNHHIEFIMTLMRSKLEFLWDMKTVNNKITTEGKCEVSWRSWNTKEMTPVLTITANGALGETPETGNFPEISFDIIMTHSLPIYFIPRENKVILTTTLSGMTTTLHCLTEFGTNRMMETTMKMSGCHKRIDIFAGNSICIPNTMSSNVTHVLPSFRGEHISSMAYENNEWVCQGTYKLLVPAVSETPIVSTTSAHLVVTPCATEAWCIPERIEMKDMEWVLPETWDLIFKHWFPSMLRRFTFPGFHLEHSNIIISREVVGETSINKWTSTLRRRGNNDEIVATMVITLTPRKMGSVIDVKAGEFEVKHEIETTVTDPMDIRSPWAYHHLLLSPWMTTNTDIKASSLLWITSCEMKMTMPYGLVRDFTFSFGNNKLTFDLDLALGQATGKATNLISWNPSTMEWEASHSVACPWMNLNLEGKGRKFRIYKCNMELDTVGIVQKIVFNLGEGNAAVIGKIGSFDLEIKTNTQEWTCVWKSRRYPWLNQTFVLAKEERDSVINYQTRHESQYHRCTSSFNWWRWRFNAKEVDCRMKNGEAGIRIEYVDEAEGRRCRITAKAYDNTKYSCLSTAIRDERSESRLICNKVQGTRRTEFVNVPVTMQDFPFMGNYWIRDKALFLLRCAENIRRISLYDERYLREQYRKERWCTNETVCVEVVRRVKSGYYSLLRELKRVTGPSIYYATNPEIAEYAVYKSLWNVPGLKWMLPEWSTVNKYSPFTRLREFWQGKNVDVWQIKVGKYLRIKLSAKVDAEGNFFLMDNYDSEKFPWLNGFGSFGIEKLEGKTILNSTDIINGWRYVLIFALEDGKLNLVASEYGSESRAKDTIWTYRWDSSAADRHNISMLMMTGGKVSFVCDLLSEPLTWSNAEVKCYEGRRRERLIGKFSAPDLSALTVQDSTNLDEILRDILNVESPEYRNRIKNSWRTWWTRNWDKSQRNENSQFNMLYRSAEYALASVCHEAAKYMTNGEEWSTRWTNWWNDWWTNWWTNWWANWWTNWWIDWWTNWRSDWWAIWRSDWWTNWRSDWWAIWRYDWWKDTSRWLGRYVSQEWVEATRPLWQPYWEYLKYSLEGDMTAEYKLEDEALVLKLLLKSNRLPIADFDTTVRVTKRSFGSIIVNVTSTNKFIRMWADALLDGPRIAIEKIGVALPDETRQFLEFRLLSNPDPTKPYSLETYFADMDGQHYGCRGTRGSWESLVIHMHCFVLEGTEFPPNPPSAKLFSHYDIPCGPRGPLAGVVVTTELIERMINPCLEDPEVVLKETYHVHDPAIRQRLARTITHNCQYWKKLIDGATPQFYRRTESQTRQRDERNSIVSLAREYRASSGEKWWRSVQRMARGYTFTQAPEFKLGFVGDLVYTAWEMSAPAVSYILTVIEYVNPEGMLKVARCAECETNYRALEILHAFKSNRFPALDQEHAIVLSSEGMINASTINNCAWGWLECEVTGMEIVPRKARFGLMNNRQGIEVVVRPEVSEEESPLMAMCFDAHCCDVRMQSWMSAEMICHPTTAGHTGEVDATCDLTPMKVLGTSAALVYEAIGIKVPKPRAISRALERTCHFQNAAFKDSVSTSLAKDVDFASDYWRNVLKGVVKAFGELSKLTYSSWWNAVVDAYDWLCDTIPKIGSIDLHRFFSETQDLIVSCLAWFQNVALGVDQSNKLLYDAGYWINKLAFDLPSYIPFLWHAEFAPHYYQTWANYLRIVGDNLMAEDNCVCGMVHGNEIEQVISLNNHMYNLPSRVRQCRYLLAAHPTEKRYQVLFMRNDLVINLDKRTISIDPMMRVFEGRRGASSRSEIPLPLFREDMYCERTERRMTCFTKFMTVVVHCANNVRTGFFIKFSSAYCPHTRGMMGFGANSTAVPPMALSNGKAATSLEEFIDHYSIEESCRVGTIPPAPEVSHEHCDALFNNEQWMATCPMRRLSWMMACQTNAHSEAEACEYAKKYNMMCHMEGRAAHFSPSCEVCKGNSKKKSSIRKVQLTVVMSLSRQTRSETLPEIMNAVRQLAIQKNVAYEISFVTFGGRNEMFMPTFHAMNGRVWMPVTEEWTLPSVDFNGPVTAYEALRNTMWYTFMNTRTTAEGVGKVYLFVVPEDMDLTYLQVSTVVNTMNEALAKSYRLIPRTCRNGAKSGGRFGVSSLFISQPKDFCLPTATEIANTIEYPYINRGVTCTCRVENIFTGEMTDDCQLAA